MGTDLPASSRCNAGSTRKKPDALVYIFNDHVTAFFFDHYSTFALGIDNEYGVADEGGGPQPAADQR